MSRIIKTTAVSTAVIFAFFLTTYSLWGARVSAGEAARKAEDIHNLASSDVIYVQDELKALYYQNLQIIELLKEIRDILDMRLEHTKT